MILMFQDTVTIFNRKDNIWYPTVLCGVEAQEIAAQSTGKDGNIPNNQCNLHIPEERMVDYRKPKEWNGEGYTLRKDDFFIIGDYGEAPVNDDDYTGACPGYQDYMKNNHDSVYQVVSVSIFKTIKHIEVMGE